MLAPIFDSGKAIVRKGIQWLSQKLQQWSRPTDGRAVLETVTDLLRPKSELASRRVVHFGVTAHPTDAWTAQQLREATPFGQGPKYLIRDNDSKYGVEFARVAAGAGIKVLKTPVAAPNANAVVERFQGSVRRECLDHLFVLGQWHLYRVIKTYVDYFNRERPHQGLDQRVPIPVAFDSSGLDRSHPIRVFPVLGGLHYVYHRAA